jgi:hypothetical protein
MLRHAALITAFLIQLAPPAGALRGTVLDALTSAPVPDAVVIVNGAGIPRKVVAASDGTFVLNNLEPGSYTLQAGRSGYVTGSYGEHNFQNSAKPIVVKTDVAPETIVVRLNPASTVSGRILNSTMKPLTGIPVRLLRYAYKSDGQHVIELAGMTTTNDLGDTGCLEFVPDGTFLRREEPPLITEIGMTSISTLSLLKRN